MDTLDEIVFEPRQVPQPPMPPIAFRRAGDSRRPVLTMPPLVVGAPYFGDMPAIRLSRMTMARDMIAQLGLTIYTEGIDGQDSGKIVAWVRYDLPAKEKPFVFKLRKTYGEPRCSETDSWESLGKKLIQEIMLETGYNVDDVNYRFCNLAYGQFAELHRIAGGATFMAHCARATGGATFMAHCARATERETAETLEEVMTKLSRIFVEYDDVLPFSRVREADPGDMMTGRLDELAKELLRLSSTHVSSLDDID